MEEKRILQEIETLMEMSDFDLKKSLKNFLAMNDYKVIEEENSLIAEGTSPICLVAHLDTVFSNEKDIFRKRDINFFYDGEQKVLWSPDGMGADDRAGVYAIIDIVKSGFRPSIIFTLGEEIGGVGAHEIILYYPVLKYILPKVKFLIELDRSGKDDCVFYYCDNKDFISWVEKYDFIFDIGSYSDISVLAPAWGIAAVNLSIGYYDEHSLCERLYLDYLLETIEKVKRMIEDCNSGKGPKNTTYIPKKIKSKNNTPSSIHCYLCKKPITFNNSIRYKNAFLCEKCYYEMV